jgi:hypothetical protein
VIYVRNKADALEALSEVLALAERNQQIVQITVRVATCMDAEARTFLADCQAGLIEGGLDRMRRRRQEAIEAAQAESDEPFIILDSSEDQLLEEVGSALDALRLAEVARQVFADQRDRLPAWLVARAIFADEAETRKALVDAVKFRSEPEAARRCLDELLRHADAARPAWGDAAPTIREACGESVKKPLRPEGPGPGDDPELLFDTVAVSDVRATLVLDLLAKGRAEALEYLEEVRKRIALLHEIEERGSK